jgi:Fimbrial assembly protein (PilN)/Type II secretion system (T2SS), protein M subtype b
MKRLAIPLLVVLGTLIPLAGAWAQPGMAKGESLPAEVERLRGYQARQRVGVRLLDGISRSLPELLWLDRLNVSRDQITIDGRAFNTNVIAKFIENLDKLPDFEEPMLRSADLEPNQTYKFTLSLRAGRSPAMKNPSLEAERDALLRGLASQGEIPEVLQRFGALLERPGITVEKLDLLPQTGQGREQVVPVEIRMKAESYHALAMSLDRIARFSPLLALDRMEARAVRDDDAIGLLAVDLRLEIPVLGLKAQ